MRIYSTKNFKILLKSTFILLGVAAVFLFAPNIAHAQSEFSKEKRDESYKKGVNIEYYKSGSVKTEIAYKRKVWYFYTNTYWTIKEYDMQGNLTRMVKKVTQTARREDREKIIKEEVFNYEPKKDNSKETIRPE